MVAASKHLVTVGPDGKIELRAPELHPGTQVEVTVMPRISTTDSGADAAEWLAKFRELQHSLNLDEKKTSEWIEQIRQEREAAGP